MSSDVLVYGLLSSPCLYLLVTLLNRPARSEEDFEFGARKLHPSQVLDSSITYSLQVAAIALFATWGYQYGMHALWVPAFWLLGYGLIAAAMSERFLTEFVNNTRFRTLHSFIAEAGRYRSVCVTAALITLVALAGPAMFEAFTVGRTVADSLPQFGPAAGGGIALAFLGMSIVYITWGGFTGVVRLDRWQLASGYGGFCTAFALALAIFADRVGGGVALLLGGLCLMTAGIMASAKIRYEIMTKSFLDALDPNYGAPRSIDRIGLIAIIGSFLIFFLLEVWLLLFSASGDLRGAMAHVFVTNSNFGFTKLAFVSLLLANGLFQFVDITQWQRLLSIAVDREALHRTVRILRGNILFGGLCGSGTWVIAVFFGMFLKNLFPDPATDAYSLLPSFLKLVISSGLPGTHWLAFFFVAGLVSIMSSTVDAMVSATSFTVRSDILSIGLGRDGSSTLSRISTVLALSVQLAIYLTVSEWAEGHVDAVLYVCYSFQLALLPSVTAMLIRRGGGLLPKLASMFAGCLGAAVPLYIGQPERAYELSPLLSVIMSWMAFIAVGGLRNQRVPSA